MKRKEPEEPIKEEKPLDLPEMDRDAVLDETLSAFEDDDEQIVETEALLDDSMDSNYELNVVEVSDVSTIGDDLEDAEIIGDLPEEVEIWK